MNPTAEAVRLALSEQLSEIRRLEDEAKQLRDALRTCREVREIDIEEIGRLRQQVHELRRKKPNARS